MLNRNQSRFTNRNESEGGRREWMKILRKDYRWEEETERTETETLQAKKEDCEI